MGYSITQYNLYKRMGILNFAEIHRGGELQVWEPYQSIKKGTDLGADLKEA